MMEDEYIRRVHKAYWDEINCELRIKFTAPAAFIQEVVHEKRYVTDVTPLGSAGTANT